MTDVIANPIASQQAPPRRGRSFWGDARRRIMRDWAAVLCLAVICVYLLVALGGVAYEMVAARSDTLKTFAEMSDYDKANQPPSAEFWLGTDWAGKSVAIKTLLGVKTSLTVGFMANIIAVPLGMILGALAGFYGRGIDSLIVWVFSTLACIPGIILLIAIKYTFHDAKLFGLDLSGVHGIYIALGITSWIGTCRLVRAEVMKARELDYVLAARAIGTPNFIILLRHVMPNVLHLGIITFSLGVIGAIKAEVMLSFLGLGVKPGTPSWGRMIDSARLNLFMGRYWELSAAVAAMFLLVLAMNIFGDRLRDALDPKLKNV